MQISKIKIGKRFRKDIGELETLKNSIKEIGLLQPIVIDENNNLIAGQRRLMACKELRESDIKVNIIKIQNALRGEYDENVIRKNFVPSEKLAIWEAVESFQHKRSRRSVSEQRDKPIKQASKILETSTDTLSKIKQIVEFNDKKLIEKMDKTGNVSEAYKEIKQQQEKKKIIKERKARIIKSDSSIILGDCLNEIDKLKNKSISMILTDPPFGINFVSNYRTTENDITRPIENDDERAFSLLKKTLEKSYKKLANNGSLYLFTTWKVIEKVKPIVAKYYKIKNILIWNKNNWGMGDLNNWADKYEMIIYADKGKHKLLGDRPINVLNFDRTSYKYHSCEKPIDLLSYLIKKSTVENELIFDPFLGSGSVAIACQKTNRKYLGIEIDKLNYNIILQRLWELQKKE